MNALCSVIKVCWLNFITKNANSFIQQSLTTNESRIDKGRAETAKIVTNTVATSMQKKEKLFSFVSVSLVVDMATRNWEQIIMVESCRIMTIVLSFDFNNWQWINLEQILLNQCRTICYDYFFIFNWDHLFSTVLFRKSTLIATFVSKYKQFNVFQKTIWFFFSLHKRRRKRAARRVNMVIWNGNFNNFNVNSFDLFQFLF